MAQIGYKADRKKILYDVSYLLKIYMSKGFTRDQAIRLAQEEIANTESHKNPISFKRQDDDWSNEVAEILRDNKNTEDYKKILKDDYSITYEQIENLDPVRSLFKGSDIKIDKLEKIILKAMKLKKGSKQAKDFMAKLRASRGKNTLGAVKKKKSAPKKKKLLSTESKSLQATLKKKKLALPHGYELKKRKLSGVNTSTYKTMAQVRRANAKNGYFFFSPKTMKFFGSKVVSSLLMGKYFITSEKQTYSSGKTETDYIVREVENNANIVTLKKFSTKDQAKAYLKTIH